MKIGIFIPTPYRSYNKVQSAIWIRALELVEPLKKLGCEVHVNNIFIKYDVCIYYRGMRKFSYLFVKFLKRISNYVIWDTCVDYFSLHEGAASDQVAFAKLITALVDGVCVTTDGIAESAALYNKNIFIMPDPLSLSKHPKKNINFDNPIFGWSGVSIKAFCLNDFGVYLSDKRIKIISESPPDLIFNYEYVKWRYESFFDEILCCDIAFLPRVIESTYTLNNSSFKALVFASVGIPIVANKLPSYLELSKYYDSIVFLEDFDNNPILAINSLRTRSRSTSRLFEMYDIDICAKKLLDWMHLFK